MDERRAMTDRAGHVVELAGDTKVLARHCRPRRDSEAGAGRAMALLIGRSGRVELTMCFA